MSAPFSNCAARRHKPTARRGIKTTKPTNEMKLHLEIGWLKGRTLWPLSFNYQTKDDFCDSSAIIIAEQIARMARRGIFLQNIMAPTTMLKRTIMVCHPKQDSQQSPEQQNNLMNSENNMYASLVQDSRSSYLLQAS